VPPRRVAVRVLPGCRGRLTVGELRRVARSVLDAEGVAPDCEVEVVLADEATVRDLNRLYRGRDEPTDVLAFASQATPPPGPLRASREGETAFVEPPGAAPSLGEVVICLPAAEAQGAVAGRTATGEVAHLLVHALLHLLAYDHEASAADSKRMRAREDALLAQLGYAGQYAHGHY
jgi:probable rRNA maturation factor